MLYYGQYATGYQINTNQRNILALPITQEEVEIKEKLIFDLKMAQNAEFALLYFYGAKDDKLALLDFLTQEKELRPDAPETELEK